MYKYFSLHCTAVIAPVYLHMQEYLHMQGLKINVSISHFIHVAEKIIMVGDWQFAY